ncbi:T6SS immunity protein Tli3 family protein [Cronobacter turicensis]|uniref:T6SS immunity protein Tli3 family protein n=1 Tax=Cronobacter turicensis TaxID=413502 RepID=UPI0030B8D7DA
MKGLTVVLFITPVFLTAGCQAKEPPIQVVYRFDDHRYLELKGWDCVGELWYTDTKRGIHTEPVSQFYQNFTKTYIHPSEKYIAIPTKNASEFIISKDYGLTWQIAVFAPESLEVKLRAWSNHSVHPDEKNAISFTVIDNQGFLVIKPYDGEDKKQRNFIYMSSKPFDDLDFRGKHHIDIGLDGNYKPLRMPESFSGWSWGTLYITDDELDQTGLKKCTITRDYLTTFPTLKATPAGIICGATWMQGDKE